MNQQEQATKRAAIFQDTINGTNDPTPWPVTMWATSGDTIWTAGTARTAGEDSVGMIYASGETIAHRNTIAGAQEPMQDRGKTPTRPTTEQDAEATDTPRKTEPTKETEQGRDHDEAGSPAADPGAKAEPPETTRRDDPERRHTDLKSTLDRFHTKLRENLDGLNTATPAPGIDRNHGQRKTL